jgi:VanZ family protein
MKLPKKSRKNYDRALSAKLFQHNFRHSDGKYVISYIVSNVIFSNAIIVKDFIKMKNKKFWWILTASWCVVIFYQSGKNADASDANSLFLVDIINRGLVTVFGSHAGVLTNFVVRKSAHFTEYMILGMLFFKSFFSGIKIWHGLFVAFLCGVVYSITDEIHQIFVPGRTAKILDVCIDSTGLAIGLLLITFAVLWRRSHQKL